MGDRVPLSLRDWALLIPVALMSWVIPFFVYKLTGSTELKSAWTASWISLVLTLGTGLGWTDVFLGSQGTPRFIAGIGALLILAGLIAAGFQIYAGPRSLIMVLLKGRPEHAHWHEGSGLAWYGIYFVAGCVFLLSAVRRWLWLTVDRKCKTLRNNRGKGDS